MNTPFSTEGPPHHIEAEQCVLGCALTDIYCLPVIWRIITADDFYRETHRHIWFAICAVADRDEPVDLITLPDELRRRKKLDVVGGMPYITALFNTVPTASNVEYYAKIVLDYSRHRQLIRLLQTSLAEATGPIDNVADLVDTIQARFATLGAENRPEGGFLPAGPIVGEVVADAEEMERRREEGLGLLTGVPTDFAQLDHMTGGLQKTDLIVIAARPSMGKTACALGIGVNAALRHGKSVAIFSLEMSPKSICQRIACTELEINSQALRAGELPAGQWDEIRKLRDRLLRNPKLFICGENAVTPQDMRLHLRRMRQQHGLDLVIVDYLQICGTEKNVNSTREKVTEIVRGLKAIAREFNVPVIALSQLSRAVESRDNKRPMLSDLIESGAIEAEADMVCFLYREAYYAMKALIASDPGRANVRVVRPTEEQSELIIGKYRNGATGTVKIGFIPQFAKFVDIKQRDILEDLYSDEPTPI